MEQTDFFDVQRKIRRRNQILFDRDSVCLQELRALLCRQSHLTIVLWAFDCMKDAVARLTQRYPEQPAAQSAYEVSLAWARGEAKMPAAKREILSCHALAKQLTDPADIALCHAVGQGCAAVHTEAHAIGMVFYELTAVVIRCGYTDYDAAVSEKIEDYITCLLAWEKRTPELENQPWAEFLLRSNAVNQESLR